MEWGCEPQSLKQTYGCECPSCGEIWDGHQVPCPLDVALRNMENNKTCWKCGSKGVLSVMPWKYEEMKAARLSKGEQQS